MRKPNSLADRVTKHVLEYLLNKFELKPGDINNIHLIITRAINKNTPKNPKNKAP
jgi:hypothetical protein